MLGTKRRATVVGLASLALAVPAVLVAPAVTAQPSYATSDELRKDVRLNRILRHLDQFQRFADRNGGNRAAGLPGYDASARYVYAELQKAGYQVRYQDFPFRAYYLNSSSFEQLAPNAQEYELGVTYSVADYSGSGSAEGTVVEVDVVEPPVGGSTSGCEDSDFANFPAGAIALIQRGTCTFGEKAVNAAEAGAAGVILYNEGNAPDRLGLLLPTLGEDTEIDIPVVGVSYETGRSLVGATVAISVDATVVDSTTRNVIAETPGGDPENVVMQGAHLDSVPEGPGINDNGSGSAALLEVALQAIKYQQNQKLRFAWWGAEEAGLVGSTLYVNDLVANNPDELARIKAYLNYDMVGSPNFVRFVYDGNQSSFPAPVPVPPGSIQIEQTFTDYYASQALASEDTQFSGRSDYQAFINNGIAAGGLFTGAEGVKTEEQAAIYGGTAGEWYDPCYHQACDDRGNINTTVLDQNADAIAHITATYAFSIQSILDAQAAAAGDAGAGAARTAEAVTAEDLAAAA